MHFPKAICGNVMKGINDIIAADMPDEVKVRAIWGNLLGYQSIVLGHMAMGRIGSKVFAGPFQGMELIEDIYNSLFTPQLLGTYEWEIHDAVEKAISKKYKHVVNIGCAYGYYAVGLALRMPNTTVHAYDIDENCRAQCKKMAELNSVADRVIIGEKFEGKDFEKFADEETLIFMDIEGAEQELLDPEAFPALQKMDVIVELHDCNIPNLSTIIPAKFSPTHMVKVLPNAPFSFPMDKILGFEYGAQHLDNLIATWEGRGGPTPYGIFTRKE